MQYCSLQHHTLLLSPVTSTAGYCFCFGSIPSFFLELFLHWSPVAYWAPTDLRSSSFSILSFCLFVVFMGFSRQEYWSGLPFPSPVDHILSALSTMTCSSWIVLYPIEMWWLDSGQPFWALEWHDLYWGWPKRKERERAGSWCYHWVESTNLGDGRVMVERADRMWSTGEGNGKPLQYSCLENPMNSMKRQNDRILKEELPRS